MAWIESHPELESHPKVFDLMSQLDLDLDQAIGKIHRFWWWCTKYAEDGDLRKHNDDRLARAVGLNGGVEAKAFVDAMVASCWIDRKPYFRVHDWWQYFGIYLQRKFADQPEKWKRIKALYGTMQESGSLLTPPAVPAVPALPDKERVSPPPPFSAFADVWNGNGGALPKVSGLTDKRKAKIRSRWIEKPNLDYWTAVVRRIASSSFCQGKNDRGWRADFDWLITNDTNHVKVMEGKYDDHSKNGVPKSDDYFARLAEQRRQEMANIH